MSSTDLAVLLLGVGVGLTFAAHGAQKAFGWWGGPGYAGWRGAIAGMGFRPVPLFTLASIGAELGGGILLALGLLTPVAAAILVAQTVVIIFQVHWAKGFWNGKGGVEFPLVLGLAAGAVGLLGPGSLSLDHAMGVAVEPGARVALLLIGLVAGAATLVLPALTTTRETAQQSH